MKKHKNPTSITPCIFFAFLMFFNETFCFDSSYETCVPKDCGDVHNISYPFFIQGLQQPHCGYPGFELHCTNNNSVPTLQIHNSDFIVRHIYYHNSSLRLVNAAVSPEKSCLRPAIKNVTLDPNRFLLDRGSNSSLVFLTNCSGELPENLTRYSVGNCGGGVELVMLGDDVNLGDGMRLCGGGGGVVAAPVEFQGGEGRRVVVDGGNYMGVMERGFTMRWLAADCGVCGRSGGRCGFNRTAFQFRCFCPDRPHRVSCKSEKRDLKPILIPVLAGSALILILISVFVTTRYRYKKKLFSYFSSKKKSQGVDDGSVYFGVPVFSYAELQHATNNFHPSRELGDGGFGVVYYGKLRDGREVAVKRLYEHNYKRVEQFMNEVDILTRLRHRNLVLLYGCTSRRSRELLLVYEYIPNGTVADHLHGDRSNPTPLPWPTRMNIAIETASALVYLHASEIIHRDVKTNNILLDHNFCVKVADFGLSRLLPNDVTHVSTAPQGTPGYVDPEYHQRYQLTDKSDVYSFGVVLIELISSMQAVDISRSRDEINLANLAINRIQRCDFDELIDPFLRSDSNGEIERMTTAVAELAFRCLQFDSELRPGMNEVLQVLKEIQVEEGREACGGAGELTGVKPPLPPPSTGNEFVKFLKNFPPSPVSIAGKWVSSSSGFLANSRL